MAGAGYKLFNSGDVLTAAQVNTYLQEQAVMRFANAAARTTALSGVLAEGMMSYLDDTNAVEVYNGTAWVSISADQTPLTTKGDLFTFTTVDARLGVGNDGETLLADSAATTGLRWQPVQSRNLVYNASMDIWQRGTSFTASGYCADRWYAAFNGATGRTVSQQTGTDQFRYVQRIQRNSGNSTTTAMDFGQSFEIADATPYAGKTVTVSFYARKGADFSGASSQLPVFVYSGTSATEANRVTTLYASGGATAGSTTAVLTTSLTRYQFTFTFGSTVTQFGIVATINWAGTASTNDYVDITGFQLEVGSIATNYTRQSSTLQGELALAQRYYWRYTATGAANMRFAQGSALSTTKAYLQIVNPVQMRTSPTAIESGGTLALYDQVTVTNITALTLETAGIGVSNLEATVASGLTQYRYYVLTANNSATAYVGFTAEL